MIMNNEDDDVFNRLKSMMNDVNITTKINLECNTENFICNMLDVNKKFCNILLLIKNTLKINDDLLFKYLKQVNEESAENISSLGILYEDIYWKKLVSHNSPITVDNRQYIRYKKGKYDIIFIVNFDSEDVKKYIDMVNYWFKVYYHFQFTIIDLKGDQKELIMKMWFVLQQLFTILHYRFDIYDNSKNTYYIQQNKDVLSNEMYQILSNYYVNNEDTLFNPLKYKKIDFYKINKLNCYLFEIISNNVISIRDITIIYEEGSDKNNTSYTENIINIENNIDYNMIKSRYQK